MGKKLMPQSKWDLNIFFRDLGLDENGTNQWANTLTINPCLYKTGDGYTDHTYTDVCIETTFAETRYIISERPEDQYGSDWFEFMDNFMQIAPPRVAKMITETINNHSYLMHN